MLNLTRSTSCPLRRTTWRISRRPPSRWRRKLRSSTPRCSCTPTMSECKCQFRSPNPAARSNRNCLAGRSCSRSCPSTRKPCSTCRYSCKPRRPNSCTPGAPHTSPRRKCCTGLRNCSLECSTCCSTRILHHSGNRPNTESTVRSCWSTFRRTGRSRVTSACSTHSGNRSRPQRKTSSCSRSSCRNCSLR